MSPVQTYLVLSLLIVAVCLFALWKGGPAERAGAAIVLAMVVAERLLHLVVSREWWPILSLAGDALTALGLLAVALRFASVWLGAAMLFYAAQFTLHSVYLVTERSSNEPLHIVINDINFAGLLLSLTVGTTLAWRKRMRDRAQPPTSPAP
jgi:hypothetical protein